MSYENKSGALRAFISRFRAVMRAGLSTSLILGFAVLAPSFAVAGETAEPGDPKPSDGLAIDAQTFQCIRDMASVRGFYVSNLYGEEALEGTLAVANSAEGGVYPAGSVVQLVPTEVMVKRGEGFDASTKNWEFFELDVTPEGSQIRARGTHDVVNRFGGNCLDCHIKAKPQWDLVCEQTHGCDPIPLTPVMVKALQKTDPRCEPVELTEEEAQMLKFLQPG